MKKSVSCPPTRHSFIHPFIHSSIHSSIPRSGAGGDPFTFRLIFCGASSLTHLLTDIKLAWAFDASLQTCSTFMCVFFCHVGLSSCWPLMSSVNTSSLWGLCDQHEPVAPTSIPCVMDDSMWTGNTFPLHSFPKANHYC